MQTGKRRRQLRPRCRIRLHAILSFERTVIRNAPRKTALVRFRVRRVATCVPRVPDQERHWMGLAGELTAHRRTNFRAQRTRRTSQDPQDRPAACKTGKGSFTSARPSRPWIQESESTAWDHGVTPGRATPGWVRGGLGPAGISDMRNSRSLTLWPSPSDGLGPSAHNGDPGPRRRAGGTPAS